MALLYVRVSTEEQAKRGYSIPEQLEALRRRARELGTDEMIEIIDEAGGDYLERPGLEQARQLVRSGKVRWFLCFDPDRFSRNLLNQLLVTDEIDKARVELVFIQHNREKTAEGNLFYAIRGAIAEFEKKKILERTQRGKRGKARMGLLPGNCRPFGYTMDTAADSLVIDETAAMWVRQIFAWACDSDPGRRMGQARIADRLNQMGAPAPRGSHWYRSTVAGILRNPVYTGVLQWGRFDHSGVYQSRRAGGERIRKRRRSAEEVIGIAVPSIISSEVWQRVQEYLVRSRGHRNGPTTYMLTGVGYCGLCGAHIQTKAMRRRYLVCANRYPSDRHTARGRREAPQPCVLPHVQAERVEAHVWKTVCRWLESPAACLKVLEGADERPDAGPAPRDELAAVKAQIGELQRAQQRILALVARAPVPAAVAEAQLWEIGARLQGLVECRAELEARAVAGERAVLPGSAGTLAAEVGRRLPRLSEAQRILLVRRLVARVVVRGKAEADWEVIPIRQ